MVKPANNGTPTPFTTKKTLILSTVLAPFRFMSTETPEPLSAFLSTTSPINNGNSPKTRKQRKSNQKSINVYFKSLINKRGPLCLYIIDGPSPKQVVENFTYLTGRHSIPPLYALGSAFFNDFQFSTRISPMSLVILS